MKATSTRELEAQRAVLLRQMRAAGPSIEGSLARVARRCGKANCRCMQGGPKHQAVILCKKVRGRSVALHVPKALQASVLEWGREHRRIKRLLKAISELNEQIVRRHVHEQRQQTAVRRSVRVTKSR